MLRFLTALILAALAFASSAANAAVDVNKANQAELESIKGIGPGLSTKIIDARKTGTFKDWSDLVDRVSGVGPGNAARFSQAGLTVGNVAYVAGAAGAAGAATADKPAANGKAKGSSKAKTPPAQTTAPAR